MTTKRSNNPGKKVKTLRAKTLSAKQARSVRGGAGQQKSIYKWKLPHGIPTK